DAEVGNGALAAEKYRVRSLPTFLAVDEHGEVRARRSGMDPSGASGFAEFLREARTDSLSEEQVLAARKSAPGDARAALAAGRWYLAQDRAADALKQLDDAVRADKDNALGVAADATWLAATVRRDNEGRARLVKEAAKYVRAFPASPQALEAAILATVG